MGQLKNFITASLESGLGWTKESVWDRMKTLEMREASQLDKAFQLNMKLAQLTGKEEYLKKAADIAEKQSKLELANSREVREAYANFAKEIREGNINFDKTKAFSESLDRGFKGSVYVDLRGADLKNATLNISERINEVKSALSTMKSTETSKNVSIEQKAEKSSETSKNTLAEQKPEKASEPKSEFQKFAESTKGMEPERHSNFVSTTEMTKQYSQSSQSSKDTGKDMTKDMGKDIGGGGLGR